MAKTTDYNAQEAEMSPMLKQFYDLKAKHPAAVLLFRCGDFYETYEQDAKVVSNVCGITLTKRTSSPKGMDYMAGFPYHALDTYLPKLVRAGKRVAICDQLEDPKLTKKLVRRGNSEQTTNATNNPINNPKTDEIMKLNINNQTNETNNVQNAQVSNPVIVASDSKSVTGEQPIQDADFEEVTADAEVKSEKPKLPAVQFSTYKTKRGDTAPQIIGFAGEDDPRWQSHKDAGHKYVSASYRRDLSGNKVYILLFGTKYMDVVKALAGAYNTDDREVWKRAEDACMAIYEQAQRDGKARWEEKKAQWAEKKAVQKAQKEQEKKCYTKEDVATMMQTLLDGGDVPEDIKKLLKAA